MFWLRKKSAIDSQIDQKTKLINDEIAKSLEHGDNWEIFDGDVGLLFTSNSSGTFYKNKVTGTILQSFLHNGHSTYLVFPAYFSLESRIGKLVKIMHEEKDKKKVIEDLNFILSYLNGTFVKSFDFQRSKTDKEQMILWLNEHNITFRITEKNSNSKFFSVYLDNEDNATLFKLRWHED